MRENPFDSEVDVLLEKHLFGDLDETEADSLLRLLEQNDDSDIFNEAVFQKVLSHCLIGQYYLSEKPGFFSELFESRESGILPPMERSATQTQAGNSDHASTPPAEDASIQASPIQASPRQDRVSGEAKHSPHYKPSSLFWISVLTLLICFVWGAYDELAPLWSTSNPEKIAAPTYFAQVASIADLRYPEGFPIWSEGQQLDENDRLKLDSGLMEIKLRNGVVLVLQGPAEFGFASSMKCFCRKGTLSVHVPTEEGHGFEVATPHASVRDLGTSFVLLVAEEKTELHVVSGKVESSWLTRDWTPFSEGTGIAVFEDKPPKQLLAEKSFFVTENAMKRFAEVSTEKLRKAKEERLARQNADPALVLQWNPAGKQLQRRGGRLADGRYPNDQSIEFHGKNDHVKAEARGSFDSLTLTATIRLDGLNRTTNTILSSDLFIDMPGLCWTVDGSGRMQLQILAAGSQTVDLYESDPCFWPKRFGVWTDVAVSYDRNEGRVAFYMNGIPVTTIPSKRDHAIVLDGLTVGNWLRRETAPVGRQFRGRIESLSIFSRTLTDEEINHFISD